MNVFQLVAFSILICIVAGIVREVKKEYYIPVILVGGVLLLIQSLNYFTSIFNTLNQIITATNISSELFMIIIKIVGVGYLIEFATSICNDSGSSSIANKIALSGKLIILTMSLPIINQLFKMVVSLL